MTIWIQANNFTYIKRHTLYIIKFLDKDERGHDWPTNPQTSLVKNEVSNAKGFALVTRYYSRSQRFTTINFGNWIGRANEFRNGAEGRETLTGSIKEILWVLSFLCRLAKEKCKRWELLADWDIRIRNVLTILLWSRQYLLKRDFSFQRVWHRVQIIQEQFRNKVIGQPRKL